MSIPRIIHQIWLGDPMSKQIRNWIETIGGHHPGWSRIIWNDSMLFELGIDTAALKGDLESWAAVTNRVRLELLRRFGGCYCDVDVEALDSLERLPLDDYEAFGAEQDEGRVCNAVIAASVRHPWIEWQLAHWDDFDQRDPASGVYLATAAPRDGVTVLPQHYFYPWLYDAELDDQVVHRDTILIHRWLKSWGKE